MSAGDAELRSVVYRGRAFGRITAEDYAEAIQELQHAMSQLEPDGDNCHVCHDSDHQAWECRHNPLVMARRAAQQQHEWRCFHCDEVFTDVTIAEEHFGTRRDPKAPHGSVELVREYEALADRCEAAEARILELDGLLNTPEVDDFDKALPLEAAHQIERWGTKHDAGKAEADWYWLIGYLAGKALFCHIAGNFEKAKHHCITAAAALRNWHAHIRTGKTHMRPGIEVPGESL